MLISWYVFSVIMFWGFCAVDALARRITNYQPELGDGAVTDYLVYTLSEHNWRDKAIAVFLAGLVPLVNTIFVCTVMLESVLSVFSLVEQLIQKIRGK